jgi:hypothetical protein
MPCTVEGHLALTEPKLVPVTNRVQIDVLAKTLPQDRLA